MIYYFIYHSTFIIAILQIIYFKNMFQKLSVETKILILDIK